MNTITELNAIKEDGKNAAINDAVERLATLPAAQVVSDERAKWSFKQWWEHVGAWEDKDGQIVFGSPMAVRALLLQSWSVVAKRGIKP